MTTPLDALAAAVDTVRTLWPGEHVEGTSAATLVAINDTLGKMRRLIDSATAQVASEIARQSRPELGPEGLAKKQGFRNPTTLLATTLGTTNGEAARLVQVGDATAPRLLLTGEHAPARHPHVGEALTAGTIGTAASSAIITMLDRVALRAGHAAIDEAERVLVGQAAGLSLDQLSKILARAEAYLDPDGVEPREDELRSQRFVHVRQDRSGAILVNAKFDPEHGAPVVMAIEAFVTAELASQQEQNASDDPDATRRSIPMMQADALTRICEHIIGCEQKDVPLRGATVVVRVSLADLESGTGHATIDGIAAPISIATARRMAADGGIIPCVLGEKSEILDWGRKKRLFTQQQKLALIERDGGCAMCGAPPGHAKAHHVQWWSHRGKTDLSNGMLLCDCCHHRIHDNGWTIRIDGPGADAAIWFIPPAHIDPSQTPRRGGRALFDYLAA